MKKFVKVLLAVLLIGLSSFSYARDAEVVISSGDYISQTGNGYGSGDCRDYGIDVLIPGKYDFVFNATNSWQSYPSNATDAVKKIIDKSNESNANKAKFDVLIDGEVIISDVVCTSKNGKMTVFSRQAELSAGKHKLTIRSKSSNWWMTRFSLTLLSTSYKSGYIYLPGTIDVNASMNPADSGDYNVYVDKCGTYNITFSGTFPGITSADSEFNKDAGDIIRLLVDNKEVATLVNIDENVTSFSGQADLPEGNHVLEIYNNGGHFSITKINISLDKEVFMKGLTTISKEELERKPSDFQYNYSNEEAGLSVSDAANNVNGFLGRLITFFAEMLTALLTPVMNLFIAILKKFLTDENGIIKSLFDIVIDIVTLWQRMWMFEVFIVLLKFLDGIVVVFNIFAGTKEIMINGQSKILFNYIFENSSVQRVFWGIFLVGIALNITFAIISITKSIATDDEEKSLKATIKEVARGALSYIMIPIFVLFSVNLASVVLKKTDDIISINSETGKLTFGNTLFLLLSMGEETSDYKDCSSDPSFTDRARSGFYYDNTKYQVSSNSSKIFDFSFYKLELSLIITIYMIVLMILSIIMFVTRMFDLILLFVVSPYFAASIPLDGGEKFKKWRMTFLAKLISGFGLVIMMKLFVAIVLPIMLGGKIIFSSMWIANTGLKLLILAGGMYAVFKSHNLIMQIINPQLALAEMGIAEVGVQAAKEVANLVKSEAGGAKGAGSPGGGGSSGGLSNQQKTIASMK